MENDNTGRDNTATERIARIYREAERYWDTRANDIHVPIAFDFAQKLLEYYPEADAEVVLAAILLHDIGWKMVPESRQRTAFGPNIQDFEARRLHETEGARLAGEILAEMGYDQRRTDEILRIIDGHDSREHALSLNDQLVKDADKLWRYTSTAVDIDHKRFGVELQSYLDYLTDQIDNCFFTSEARELAGSTLLETRRFLQGC
jgi:HD superfamily phosphodiesterase